MHLIYEALKKTGGKTDGDALIAAAKGMAWESPRGPMSIDPETRDVVQTVYIRRVEKVGGELRQCRVRQGRERQGSGQGAHEVNACRRTNDAAEVGAAAWRSRACRSCDSVPARWEDVMHRTILAIAGVAMAALAADQRECAARSRSA